MIRGTELLPTPSYREGHYFLTTNQQHEFEPRSKVKNISGLIGVVIGRMKMLPRYKWLTDSRQSDIYKESQKVMHLIHDTCAWFHLEFLKSSTFSSYKEAQEPQIFWATEEKFECPFHVLMPVQPVRLRSASFVRRIGNNTRANPTIRPDTAAMEQQQSLFFQRIASDYRDFFDGVNQTSKSKHPNHDWKDQVMSALPVVVAEVTHMLLFPSKNVLGIPDDVPENEILEMITAQVTIWMSGIEGKHGSVLCPVIPKSVTKLRNVMGRVVRGAREFRHVRINPEFQSSYNEMQRALRGGRVTTTRDSTAREREALRELARKRIYKVEKQRSTGMGIKDEMMIRRANAPISKWYELNDPNLNVKADVRTRFVLENLTPLVQTYIDRVGTSRSNDEKGTTSMVWSLK